jgi:hypothetical protein
MIKQDDPLNPLSNRASFLRWGYDLVLRAMN